MMNLPATATCAPGLPDDLSLYLDKKTLGGRLACRQAGILPGGKTSPIRPVARIFHGALRNLTFFPRGKMPRSTAAKMAAATPNAYPIGWGEENPLAPRKPV